MEQYIEVALAAGFVSPSTSPATAGFFFVEMKDGGSGHAMITTALMP